MEGHAQPVIGKPGAGFQNEGESEMVGQKVIFSHQVIKLDGFVEEVEGHEATYHGVVEVGVWEMGLVENELGVVVVSGSVIR